MLPWNPAKAARAERCLRPPRAKRKPLADFRAAKLGHGLELAPQWRAWCCQPVPRGTGDAEHPGQLHRRPNAYATEAVSPMPGKVTVWERWARSLSPGGCKILSLPVCALFCVSERRSELALSPSTTSWGRLGELGARESRALFCRNVPTSTPSDLWYLESLQLVCGDGVWIRAPQCIGNRACGSPVSSES